MHPQPAMRVTVRGERENVCETEGREREERAPPAMSGKRMRLGMRRVGSADNVTPCVCHAFRKSHLARLQVSLVLQGCSQMHTINKGKQSQHTLSSGLLMVTSGHSTSWLVNRSWIQPQSTGPPPPQYVIITVELTCCCRITSQRLASKQHTPTHLLPTKSRTLWAVSCCAFLLGKLAQTGEHQHSCVGLDPTLGSPTSVCVARGAKQTVSKALERLVRCVVVWIGWDVWGMGALAACE